MKKVKQLSGTPILIGCEQQDLIGEGAFGKVYKAFSKDDPIKKLAVKVVQNNGQGLQTMARQLQIISKIPEHPNLVHYKKVKISSKKHVYMLMEECQCNSACYFKKLQRGERHGCLIRFLIQFCEGYKQLYKRNIIHRDIKPQNILVLEDNFKISDFGLSKKGLRNISSKGTLPFMAPQLFAEQKSKVSNKIDIYSLAVTLNCLLSINSFQENQINQPFCTLVPMCLKQQPNERMSWQDLFERVESLRGRTIKAQITRKSSLVSSKLLKQYLVLSFSFVQTIKLINLKLQSQVADRRQIILFLDSFVTKLLNRFSHHLGQELTQLIAGGLVKMSLNINRQLLNLLQNKDSLIKEQQFYLFKGTYQFKCYETVINQDRAYLIQFDKELSLRKIDHRQVHHHLLQLQEHLFAMRLSGKVDRQTLIFQLQLREVINFIEKRTSKSILLQQQAECALQRFVNQLRYLTIPQMLKKLL